MENIQKRAFLYLGIAILLVILDIILPDIFLFLLLVELSALGFAIAALIQSIKMIKKNMMLLGIVILIVAGIIVLIYVSAFVFGLFSGFQGTTGQIVRSLVH